MTTKADQYNGFETFITFQQTDIFKRFIFCPHHIIAPFTGNQWGKTTSVAYGQYVLRILGWHPIPQKNVLYFECPIMKCLKCGENFNRNIGIKCPRCNSQDVCPTCPPKITERLIGFGLKQEDILGYVVDSNPYVPELRRPIDNLCPQCGTLIQVHKRFCKIFRFCSETLPAEKVDAENLGEGEVKNTIYPAFKKWLPPYLIKQDKTFRNCTLRLYDPYNNWNFGEGKNAIHYEGDDIIVEFCSYSQSVQSQSGVQRLSVWCDEEPPFEYYIEEKRRLIKENGDFLISVTPASRVTWMYDEIFEKAQTYFRTPRVCERLREKGQIVTEIEKTDSPYSIAVIMASAYDNPTLDPKVIDRNFEGEDEDVVDIRCYGLFTQSSNRIFKNFTPNVHVIDPDKWFPDGKIFIDNNWVKARLIDYHEKNPWAVIFIALSPEDEAFVWWEFNPSPEKMVTIEIADKIADESRDYTFRLNLIDPLATKKQPNTGRSVVDDLDERFRQLKRERFCTGGCWEGWDTKSTRGRDEINKRLKNSLKVDVPFNNQIIEDHRTVRLPTLWIFNNCWETIRSLKNWRTEERIITKNSHTQEKKETPCQRYSHYCTALEAVFKDRRFVVQHMGTPFQGRQIERFQGRHYNA